MTRVQCADESTGGAGIDYFFFKNRLKLSLEAFDFGKNSNPHIKTGATYYINKYFHLTAGGDDIISRRGFASFYLGGGFMFDDDDLKYLMGSAPTSALKN
jgi:phospholipid/cholesterol/gamma-HCH transport system substrate-binding protein